MASNNNQSTGVRDLFISHRGSDDKWAEGLAERLELNSCQVWIDNRDIKPGESIPGSISRGLEISRYVAIVMTPRYFADNAEWTSAEWHAALFSDPDGRHSRVIPLYVENCPRIPPLLSHIRWIDFRDKNDYKKACDELLRTIQGRQSRFPSRVAGQTITADGHISKETLFVERASISGKPDSIDEDLGSNLLPATKLPLYVWSAPLASALGKQTGHGLVFPPKTQLKEIVHKWQVEQKLNPFTPAFTRHEDRIWALYNLNSQGHPFAPIIGSTDIVRKSVSELMADADHRKLLSELLTMCINRHCYRVGLAQYEKERFMFRTPNGKDVVKRWRLRNPAERTVTRCFPRDDGTTNFYYHDAVFISILFLSNKPYLRIKPTIAFSGDGTEKTVLTGPRVGPMAMHWTARQKNIDVFRDLRFWIYQLACGQSTIRIYAGDQVLEFDTRPATIHIHGGIAHDQSNIEELLERLPVAPDERELEVSQHFETPEDSDGDL